MRSLGRGDGENEQTHGCGARDCRGGDRRGPGHRHYPTREEEGSILGRRENASLWPAIVDAYPPYDEYQARTDRDIPVFVCDPVD